MKKQLLLVLLCTIFLIGNLSALTQISNCTELQNMNLNLAEDYELTANIDCSDTINWNGGQGFISVGNATDYYSGIFDGKGYNITDLFINRSSVENQGLFGVINSASIINIGLINVYIWGQYDVGGLIGYSESGIINNSFSTGNIISDFASGGLIGYATDTLITNSYSTSDNIVLNDGDSCGGLVGYADGNTIINMSYATGNSFAEFGYVGGLVGFVEVVIIDNSYATGNVNGYEGMGGLVGASNGVNISNSYSTGNVTGDEALGGLIGEGIIDCINSYWNIEMSGQNSSVCGTGLTTSEMKIQSSFIDWDFDIIWNITPNYFPCLQFNCILYPEFLEEELQQETQFTETGQVIYSVMSSSGAGLGIFMNFMGQALPVLLFGLLFVGIIVVIGYSIFSFFKHWGINHRTDY